MKKSRILFLSILSMLIIVSSCKKDDPDPVVNEAEVLVAYVEANFSPSTVPAYITNSALADAMLASDPYIIDIRSAGDWAAGHIDGAVNVDSKELLTHLVGASVATDKDIAVVCYTGQTAGWATALLRLAGYSNAKSLKFGMSSWHTTLYGGMTSNVGDAYAQFTETTSNAKGAAGELPEINTGFDNGADILAARIATVFAAGFGNTAVLNSVVVPGRADWYIVNYWSAAHYDTEHVEGAIMYDPTASPHPFTTAGDLLTIPSGAAENVAIYCYTGQTSAFMAAYFHVLGYENVKTLKFGANGMFVSTMPGTTWTSYVAANVTDRTLIVEN